MRLYAMWTVEETIIALCSLVLDAHVFQNAHFKRELHFAHTLGDVKGFPSTKYATQLHTTRVNEHHPDPLSTLCAEREV